MTRTGRLAAALTGLALLGVAACGSSSPEAELAQRADAVTTAANQRDAGALRTAAQELADTVSAQSDDGTLPAERASSLLALADELYEQADLVDPQVRARQEAEERTRQAEQDAAAAREQADREKAAREEAAREQAAREKAAREQQAAREQAEREAEREKDRDEDDEDKGKGKDAKDDD